MDMNGTIREINSLKNEITRINLQKKKLLDQKKVAEAKLYKYMAKSNIGEMGGITQKSIRPKGENQTKRKPISEQRDDAYELFYNNGIRDPKNMWDELQKLKKYQSENSSD